MGTRTADGSAGDADYGAIGGEYAQYRRPDPRLFEVISEALGEARTVLNVGAGAGSYEPTDRQVTAVEPSESMRAQRPAHLSPALDGTAESLPFPDDSFDASMTTFSIHQWQDTAAGLREMRRVTRGPVVILTCDPQRVEDFWLSEYAPEVTATEARRYPGLDELETALGGHTRSTLVPIPLDCTDGFNEAYYGRPEAMLAPGTRLSCSAWSFVPEGATERFMQELGRALDSGAWDARHGALRTLPEFEGSLVLVVSEP